MPAESQLVVTCIVAAFMIFMVTLGGALVWTWAGDRAVHRRPARAAAQPGSSDHRRAA